MLTFCDGKYTFGDVYYFNSHAGVVIGQYDSEPLLVFPSTYPDSYNRYADYAVSMEYKLEIHDSTRCRSVYPGRLNKRDCTDPSVLAFANKCLDGTIKPIPWTWEIIGDKVKCQYRAYPITNTVETGTATKISGNVHFINNVINTQKSIKVSTPDGELDVGLYNINGYDAVYIPLKEAGKLPSYDVDELYDPKSASSYLSTLDKVFKGKKIYYGKTNIYATIKSALGILKNGDVAFPINKQTAKLAVSFLDSVTVKDMDDVDTTQFVCIEEYLLKQVDGNYVRVVPSVLHTHIPINRCEECEVFTKVENGVLVEGNFYCNEHATPYARKCSLCKNQFYAIEPLFLNNKKDNIVCYTCYQNDCYECTHHSPVQIHSLSHVCTSDTQISGYSYKPKQTRFVGKDSKYPFFLGMELELHAYKPRDVGTYIRQTFPGDFYFKSDSTIVDGGLEIVSTPHTRESFERIDLSPIMDKFAGAVAAEAHGGIHIHMDRKAFQEEQLRNIVLLLYKAKKQVEIIAGRASERYAKILSPEQAYPSVYDRRETPLIECRKCDRYLALNFQNANTLEYRLFDSTLFFKKMQKNFDFVSALWKFGLEATTIDYGNFKSFVDSEKEQFPYLQEYILATKGL